MAFSIVHDIVHRRHFRRGLVDLGQFDLGALHFRGRARSATTVDFQISLADDSVLRKLGLNIPLDLWKPALLLAGGFTFLWHLKNRMSPPQACLAALMITFLIYPAGHHQFQAVLFFLAFMEVTRAVALQPAWRRYLKFLGVYTLLFGVTDGFCRFELSWAYNIITPLAFVLGIRAWFASLKAAKKIANNPP